MISRLGLTLDIKMSSCVNLGSFVFVFHQIFEVKEEGEELYSEYAKFNVKQCYMIVVLLLSVDKDMVWAIKAQDWMNKVAEDANLCLYVKAAVDETGQIFIKNKDTPIDKPDLELTVKSVCYKTKLYIIKVVLTN